MFKQYNVAAIVNFFLEKSEKESKKINLKTLMNLVYFSYGWHLALYNKNLLDDTYCWMWHRYGIIFNDVFHFYKQYGDSPIYTDDFMGVIGVPLFPKVNDERTKRLLESVWRNYKDSKFSSITHKPFLTIALSNPSSHSVPMDDNEIKEFFLNLRKQGTSL